MITAPSSSDDLEPTAWFRDAKFGLFLHWGPYSVAGVEASWPIMEPSLVRRLGAQQEISEVDYVALARRFDPVDFDPADWVRQVRRAGMRYIVITAKHHDGFCMFDAPGTDYKITKTPYGGDILAELAAACADQKMPLGFYYSPPDMHHPAYRDTNRPARENWPGEPERAAWPEYLDYMESHLRMLLQHYGDVAILWFDGLFGHDKYDPERFHALVRELSPKTLVNDRLGPELGDYVTPEQAIPTGIPIRRSEPAPEITTEMFRQFVALVDQGLTGEQIGAIFEASQKSRFPTSLHPAPDQFQLWETCMTMNNTWAYNPADPDYKSADVLVRALIDTASRGGNLLLNVGPTARGSFPEEASDRLRAVGDWLAAHGEAVYGTTYGPIQGRPDLRTASTAKRIFIHLLEWPEGNLDLEVGSTRAPVASITLLASGESCSFEQTGDHLSIALAQQPPAPAPSVLVLALA